MIYLYKKGSGEVAAFQSVILVGGYDIKNSVINGTGHYYVESRTKVESKMHDRL